MTTGYNLLLVLSFGCTLDPLTTSAHVWPSSSVSNSYSKYGLKSALFPETLSRTNTTNTYINNDWKNDTTRLMPGNTSVVPLERITDDAFAQLQQVNFQKATKTNPLKIFLYLRGREKWLFDQENKHLLDGLLRNELKHFVLDGIVQSPFLTLVTNSSQADVVVGRTGKEKWCGLFGNFVQKNIASNNNVNRTIPPILVMDWDDLTPLHACPNLLDDVAKSNLFYTKRGIVNGRHYNSKSSQELGQIHSFPEWRDIAGAPLRHTPYAVRTDFVEALERVLMERHPNVNSSLSQLEGVGLPTMERPKDVVHFWPSNGLGVDAGGPNHHNSYLRDGVSRLLESFSTKDPTITTFAGLAGTANIVGRNEVDLDYPRTILQYKVVVVAQKDDWEDHYRLMEGLASGALVMSDTMLSIPPDFSDGESIVFYRDLEDLETKVLYYLHHEEERLRIAHRGWTLAMHRHRSWHRMEEVLFGEIRSPACLKGLN